MVGVYISVSAHGPHKMVAWAVVCPALVWAHALMLMDLPVCLQLIMLFSLKSFGASEPFITVFGGLSQGDNGSRIMG